MGHQNQPWMTNMVLKVLFCLFSSFLLQYLCLSLRTNHLYIISIFHSFLPFFSPGSRSGIVSTDKVPTHTESTLPLLRPILHHLVDAIVPVPKLRCILAVLGPLVTPNYPYNLQDRYDNYQCTNVETLNCFMEENVIIDVAYTNSVEINSRRDTSTKNDGFGPKGVKCERKLTQNFYIIPSKIQVEVCKNDIHRYYEKFSIFPFPVEEQNCRFEPKKFCELEMKAKKYSYTKDCKEQPREICDHYEKALRPVFENQQRLECKYYKPVVTCRDEDKQYCVI